MSATLPERLPFRSASFPCNGRSSCGGRGRDVSSHAHVNVANRGKLADLEPPVSVGELTTGSDWSYARISAGENADALCDGHESGGDYREDSAAGRRLQNCQRSG